MSAHPWEYHKTWQNSRDLKFYLAVMGLSIHIIAIKKIIIMILG